MLRSSSWLAALVIALGVGAPASAAEPADLELVMAIDISGSIDQDEARLQRQGYVNAFRDPQVIKAIRSGPNGRIAVAYFEWSSFNSYRLVLDWTPVGDAASSNALADTLAAVPIMRGMRTSISGAIDYAIPLFERSGYESPRRVLDISGDGPNNDGGLITVFRDRAIARGITINGLPVINERPNQFGFPTLPDLDKYYEGCVIGGPGAFVEIARDFEDFDRAVRRKLILEIAGLKPELAPPGRATRWAGPAARAGSLRRAVADHVYDKGCDIGERQSREFWRSRPLQ
jgi:hypothetical protein